ncbi:MAG: methylmalonyl Co-A mutase-associated GTPase MeaB [bacterium]|nr:methylmalonyl Co-A mutase-associated GTPase MeaB [bacterium]
MIKQSAPSVRDLARAITWAESANTHHHEKALSFLKNLPPAPKNSLRIGISGAPGAGKSTLIETLGLQLINKGKRVAVLAIDPSSPESGGAILGDKTRMETLAQNPSAFVRPSPSKGELGGTQRNTLLSLQLCERSGFDIVIIETVGVGQSEISVHSLVDVFLVLLTPALGDTLQGMKKGILELADIVAINKADGPLKEIAQKTAAHYQSAFDLQGKKAPALHLISALEGLGISELCETLLPHGTGSEKEKKRQQKIERWIWEEAEKQICADFRKNSDVLKTFRTLTKSSDNPTLLPEEIAQRMAESHLK